MKTFSNKNTLFKKLYKGYLLNWVYIMSIIVLRDSDYTEVLAIKVLHLFEFATLLVLYNFEIKQIRHACVFKLTQTAE